MYVAHRAASSLIFLGTTSSPSVEWEGEATLKEGTKEDEVEEQQHRFPSSKLRSDPERKKRKNKRKEVGRGGRRNRHVTTSSRSLPPSHGKGREGKVVLPQLDLL